MRDLMATDPTNLQCLLGAAAHRANAGLSSPMIDEARVEDARRITHVEVHANDPKDNFLSNWDIMHLVLPAAFMMAQKKEDNRREHRTPIRVRRTFGAENIEDEDPIIVLGDLLDGLGVKDKHNRSSLNQQHSKGVYFTPLTRQVPDRNLLRMHMITKCIRLSQLRAVILGINPPFGKVFLDVLTANGMRLHAGDAMIVEDAAKHRAAMRDLMATDPTNLQCLLGAAANRANAGLSSPMIDEARAAGAAGPTMLGAAPPPPAADTAAPGDPLDSALMTAVANMTEKDAQNMQLVIRNKELDLEKDRPGTVDKLTDLSTARTAEIKEDLRACREKLDMYMEKLDKEVAVHGAKLDQEVAVHGAKLDQEVAVHGAKLDQEAAARREKIAEETTARKEETTARKEDHERDMERMRLQFEIAKHSTGHKRNRDQRVQPRDQPRDNKRTRRSRSPRDGNRQASLPRSHVANVTWNLPNFA
jgi:hypothetical protein